VAETISGLGVSGGGCSGEVGSVGGDSGAWPVHVEKTNKQQIRTMSETADHIETFISRLRKLTNADVVLIL
jgi:hypothetical protein